MTGASVPRSSPGRGMLQMNICSQCTAPGATCALHSQAQSFLSPCSLGPFLQCRQVLAASYMNVECEVTVLTYSLDGNTSSCKAFQTLVHAWSIPKEAKLKARPGPSTVVCKGGFPCAAHSYQSRQNNACSLGDQELIYSLTPNVDR